VTSRPGPAATKKSVDGYSDSKVLQLGFSCPLTYISRMKKKNPAAIALGRMGGKKGGPARAASMTPAERSDAARKAVMARWARKKA
jgi:hypothetical protein